MLYSLMFLCRHWPRSGFGFLLGVSGSLGIHVYFFDYNVVEEIDQDQFLAFTDQVIAFEGGWKRGDDASYAGVDSLAHPNSPLWGYDLSSSPSDVVKREVYRIYMRDYYQRMRIHDLPQAIGFLIYDFGVHSGVYTSVKTAQQIAFTNPHEIDGYMGAHTVRALQKAGNGLSLSLTFQRLAHYANVIAKNPAKEAKYALGWTHRAKRAFIYAKTLQHTGD